MYPRRRCQQNSIPQPLEPGVSLLRITTALHQYLLFTFLPLMWYLLDDVHLQGPAQTSLQQNIMPRRYHVKSNPTNDGVCSTPSQQPKNQAKRNPPYGSTNLLSIKFTHVVALTSSDSC
ncbi:hypothetical protein EJ02DRAFT_103514 [Clathrospora elynae]|uniref:Uncharacterized protein n=1 Tax=Clathrospora elynae TaxID=706981 RepID=A0A6A5SWC8_9PLEO|nr:hypothetical protein EJ02DRAFT_103514 [Clathrospora elynae]